MTAKKPANQRKGYSNREVLDTIQKITGQELTIQEEPRPKGYPAVIFADNNKAKQFLGFNPKTF